MTGTAILTAIRGAILIAIAAAFLVSLVNSVLGDQRLPLIGLGSPSNAQRDPGVRVLLADRRSIDQAVQILPHHERLTIAILRPAWLVAPEHSDDPNYTLKLDRGEQLLIRPDVDGLVFSSATWGQEQRWPVPGLRIVPQATTEHPTAEDHPTRWPMGRFEDIDREAVFAIGSRRYRGGVDVRFVNSKQLHVINTLPIESYVEGVLAIEMKASFPLEALKAQAIASRTHAYARAWMALQAKQPYDLSDALDGQDYHGHGLGGEFTQRAVRETAGRILVTPRLRLPFVPQFCAANGGWTEATEAVFPGAKDVTQRESVADIMPVQRDPFSEKGAVALGYLSTHGEQQTLIEPDDLQKRLQAWVREKDDRTTTIGYITDLAIGERDPRSGRVRTVVISHTPLQRLEVSGHDLRTIVGPHRLRSTLWTNLESRVRTGERRVKDWIITLRGYGHGVGMSQISAWAMATDGFTSSQILQTFYPGAEIVGW